MKVTSSEKICTEWRVDLRVNGFYKEILDGKALFKWCCGRRMRRISGYQQVRGKTYHLGYGTPLVVGWYCEVCERREENSAEML